jgi:hypothetical protein
MVLKLARKIVSSPVWVLWKLYNGLWWAFSDDVGAAPTQAATPSPVGAKTRAAAQDSAFQVIDSNDEVIRPATPDNRPLGTLKWGFGSTILVSILTAWVCHEAYSSGALRYSTSIWFWAWATSMTCVGSLWAVRHIARQQAEQHPQNWRGHARATAAGFKDMGRSIADAATTSKNVAKNAGVHAANAYRVSRDGVRKVAHRVRPS